MKRLLYLWVVTKLGRILAIFSILGLAACSRDSIWSAYDCPNPGWRQPTEDPGFDNVFIIYCAAYNNLQSDININLSELCEGYVPGPNAKDAIVVFNHSSVSDYDHTIPTNPVLYRIYNNGDGVVRDTLKIYGSDVCSADPSTVKDVMMLVRDKFPAGHYGFLISSHGTGWLPPQYETGSETRSRPAASAAPTAVGVQQGEHENVWMSSHELAEALPFHLDYILFDACLMSSIEVIYEFREKCDYIVAAPTEVLSSGFVYEKMTQHLMGGGGPDLEAVCSDLVAMRTSATVALIDCSKVEPVADACRTIFSNHASCILDISEKAIQSYNVTFDYNYDLRDMCRVMGAGQSELDALDAALRECIPYKNSTLYFLSRKIDPERFCGVSSYLPRRSSPILNGLYRQTEWNRRTGLLK